MSICSDFDNYLHVSTETPDFERKNDSSTKVPVPNLNIVHLLKKECHSRAGHTSTEEQLQCTTLNYGL